MANSLRAHVELRGVSLDDAPDITRLLEGDSELALQTATIPIPYSIENAKQFVRMVDPRFIFAVVVGDELIGMVGMSDGSEPVEIGYWIGRVHWRKGYATAAVGLLMEEAVSRGIKQFTAEVFPDNSASMRVLEKNGFLRVGEVQRDLPQRGGLRQMIRFKRKRGDGESPSGERSSHLR